MLPQDRESIFYFNVREVPPKSERPNVMQLALHTKIKLFYRPKAILPEKYSRWDNQLVLHKVNGGYRVENPTPYYITIISLSRVKGEKITKFPGIMIAPKSSMEFSVTDGGVRDFAMMYVNDYGGHPELKYRCEGNTCKALPPSQQG